MLSLLSLSLLLQYKPTGIVVRPDVQLPYRIIGKGAPVLMLSGGPGFVCDYMEKLAEGVGKDKYQWILLEQRGTPRAKLKAYNGETLSMKKYVDDLEALREKLGLKKWTVAGQSWGSVLAEGYTAAHPDRVTSLVLMSTPGPDMSWVFYASDNIQRALSPEDKVKVADAQRKYSFDADALMYNTFVANLPAYLYNRELAKDVVAVFKADSVEGKTTSLVLTNLTQQGWNVSKELGKFKGPALILQGRQDFLGEGGAIRAAQALPNSQLTFVERAGHMSFLDSPTAFFNSLSKFLQKNAR